MSAGQEIVAVGDAGALEADPVAYMAVVLNRAKGWLGEAQSIDVVREAKAIAVGYESVIREKELAFDAQLSATEIVRRCERRIGELVREGQRAGSIATRGVNRYVLEAHGDALLSPHDAAGIDRNSRTTLRDYYAAADATGEDFERAVGEAREEGNLSRANVVRKVKDEKPKQPERSEWHRKRPHIDSNRILRTLADDLDAACTGLDLIDADTLDANLANECVASIRRSLSIINSHVRRVQR
jgi:hypothetical protein